MKCKATIEILFDEEAVLGSPTIGKYMVRYFDEDDEPVGGSFHETIQEAHDDVLDYQKTHNKDNS